MLTTHLLGFPRIGAQGELAFAIDAFRRQELDEAGLVAIGRELRLRHWNWQSAAGLAFVSVGDFSYHDQILDTVVLLGAVPRRFGFAPGQLNRRQYFELAQGNAAQAALESRQWFETDYDYLQPEFDAETRFDGGPDWLFDELQEATLAGFDAKPQLPGPLTLLRLARVEGIDALGLLGRLVPAYVRLLKRLGADGARWVQLDEPILGLDLEADWLSAFAPVYRELATAGPQLLLATYFNPVTERGALLRELPVAAVHLDAVCAPEQLAALLPDWPEDRILSLGVIDGRRIWKTDLDAVLDQLEPIRRRFGQRLWLAPSCSLLHVPVDLKCENDLEPALRDGFAFARQKLGELGTLARALDLGRAVCFQALENQRQARSRFAALPGHLRTDLAWHLAPIPGKTDPDAVQQVYSGVSESLDRVV